MLFANSGDLPTFDPPNFKHTSTARRDTVLGLLRLWMEKKVRCVRQ